MKAIVYDAKDQLEVMDYPIPEPQPGEVLLKVIWAGICGSDMVAWNGGFKRIIKPVVLGHELIGEIVQINGATAENDFQPGEYVVAEPLVSCGRCEACRTGHYNVCSKLQVIGLDRDGCFASYVAVPSERLHHVPKTLSTERAALCEPVAVAIHMVRRTQLKIGDSAAVLGAGPIGLLVAMVARRAGASKIMLTDINRYRLDLARGMGFEAVDGNQNPLDVFKNYFGPEGADISFEVAAQKATLDLACKISKIRGTVLAGGLFKESPPIALQEVSLREQHVIGTRVYTFSDFEAALNLLAQEDFPVERLISKRLDVDKAITEGFQAIRNGVDVMKILIKFD